MIRGLLFLFLSLSLFAGTVINQNIYEKENAVDVMLSFDTPYKGKIIKKKEAENKVFLLKDMTIEKKSVTEIASPIVQKLQLIPLGKELYIEFSGVDDFKVDASKTVDNYGLRLRVTPVNALSEVAPIKEPNFETKKEENISGAYLKVLVILALLIASLFLLKNWLQKRGGDFQGTWLFDKKSDQIHSGIKVKQQRAVDMKNRLALISYRNREYLLLLGTSNLLLDTFDADGIHQKSKFDEVLTENEEELNEFIKLKKRKFDDYKQKVST